MVEDFEFEEITLEEKKLLLSAFNYSVNEKNEIVDELLKDVVRSDE